MTSGSGVCASNSTLKAWSSRPRIGASAAVATRTSTLSCDGRSDKIVVVRVCGRGGPRRDAELGEDVADMTGHGLLTDEALAPDGAVRVAPCEQDEHLELAPRQPVRERLSSRRAVARHRARAQVIEFGTRRIGLHSGRVVIAEGLA